MLRGDRLAEAKGLLMALMRAAAAARERVALLCFAGQRTALRVPPTRAGAWREDWITPISGGGGTAVEPALRRATLLLARHRRQRPDDWRTLWLLTDGRTPENPSRPGFAQRIVIIDFDRGRDALHRTARWARRWQDGRAGAAGTGDAGTSDARGNHARNTVQVDWLAASALLEHLDALSR